MAQKNKMRPLNNRQPTEPCKCVKHLDNKLTACKDLLSLMKGAASCHECVCV